MAQNKILVIAEKPSVGKDIARVLKCNQNLNGAMEGKDYIVTWGLGHLVTLADPEQYNEVYKQWDLNNLPIIPDRLQLEVIKQTRKQFNVVKTQIQRKEVGSLVIATDAGREGELVARWILDKSGSKKPMKRLWISSVTDKAIREGFSALKDGSLYDNLYRAALSRAEADWLVGINATRALTCRYNAQLSCGRVQTPTLAMIQKKEDEIYSFKPRTFYGIQIEVLTNQKDRLVLQWKDAKSGNSHSFDKEYVQKIKAALEQRCSTGRVTQIKKKDKKTYAPLLYDLTQLQREANKRYDFSAKTTLNIMQRLYESHKVLTYPRTDSRYITSDVFETLKERLEACGVGVYKKYANLLSRKKLTSNTSFVDNKKVSDHHAIIPTEQFVQMDRMSTEEKKIYDLVVRRFLAVLYPPYEYEETVMEACFDLENFALKGKCVKQLGWREVYENASYEDDLEKEIPITLQKEDALIVQSVKLIEGKTQAPAHFTEATLLTAMENPENYMDSKDKADIKMLGETGGLGTVATRADIIEKLFHSFLIEKRGKEIFITSKGKQLLELVPEDLKKPELTADWERRLQQIATGKLRRDVFMKDIKKYTNLLVEEIKGGQGQFRHDNMTKHKCPECGKKLLLVKGKNSTLHVCQDRQCGYKETISRTSNARCPKCHKKMELFGVKENETFICACGYKEKMNAFLERRKKDGAGVSKKEVGKYLNQIKKEQEPLNNAFAAAFSKIKEDTKF